MGVSVVPLPPALASEPGVYFAVCTGLTSNYFLDNTGDVRAAVSRANRCQALPLLFYFLLGRGESLRTRLHAPRASLNRIETGFKPPSGSGLRYQLANQFLSIETGLGTDLSATCKRSYPPKRLRDITLSIYTAHNCLRTLLCF